jgi:hypothetical protein
MTFQPHCLQFAMMSFRESIVFENVVQFTKVAHMECDQSAGAQYRFILVQFGTGGMRDWQ